MHTNLLAHATALADNQLLARLQVLAGREREATADLVAHLAALAARPALHAAEGHGSLFSYCTRVLQLSEDAACNRIEAARAAIRFPRILELLESGDLSLTTVRLLARHLTPENQVEVLKRAIGLTRHQVEALIAELAPRPDVASTVRKLPGPRGAAASAPLVEATVASAPTMPPAAPPLAALRPVVQSLAPRRYRVQFTISQETQEKLRRLQALLRREITDGDPSAIFDRALTALAEKVEKAKLAAVHRPSIRPGTDRSRSQTPRSRHVPSPVKRTVWQRDAGQCAFVSAGGQRCEERAFLELHHIRPFAYGGPPTVENISLRCRRHNQYEAGLVFKPPDATQR